MLKRSAPYSRVLKPKDLTKHLFFISTFKEHQLPSLPTERAFGNLASFRNAVQTTIYPWCLTGEQVDTPDCGIHSWRAED